MELTNVGRLAAGDIVDLLNDAYGDPQAEHDVTPVHRLLQQVNLLVTDVKQVGMDVVVTFDDSLEVAFPSDHEVWVVDEHNTKENE